jgi:DNA-binding MarR family transcriptional regulator
MRAGFDAWEIEVSLLMPGCGRRGSQPPVLDNPSSAVYIYNQLYNVLAKWNGATQMAHFTETHAFKGAFVANQLSALVDLIALQGDSLLEDAGITIPSRAVSCVLLVGDQGQVSAADVAKALQQPHQLATQRVEALIKLGLLKRIDDPKDGRRKILTLSAKGRDQYARLNARLAEVEQAFLGLFAEVGCDLPAVVERTLQALRSTPLLKRIHGKAAAARASTSRKGRQS